MNTIRNVKNYFNCKNRENERASDNGSHSYITLLVDLNFKYSLGYAKATATWVLCLPTNDHKRYRVITSKECMALSKRNVDVFLRHFVTKDQIWIHQQYTGDQAPIDIVDFS